MFFFPPSELHLSIKENVSPPSFSFISCHSLSWQHLGEIVLSIHPLSISSLLTAVASVSLIGKKIPLPSLSLFCFLFLDLISLCISLSHSSSPSSCPPLPLFNFFLQLSFQPVFLLSIPVPRLSLSSSAVPHFLVTFRFAISHLVYFLFPPPLFLFPSFSPHII